MTDGQLSSSPCFEFLSSMANRARHKVAVTICVMQLDSANTDDIVGLSF
jgi:hypothetical protein